MWTGWTCPGSLKSVMKTTARTLLATFATTVISLHAQETGPPVTIPGMNGGGETTDPQIGELNGTGGRAVLRQPFTGGIVLPPWAETEKDPTLSGGRGPGGAGGRFRLRARG